jgi:hypothetical protein
MIVDWRAPCRYRANPTRVKGVISISRCLQKRRHPQVIASLMLGRWLDFGLGKSGFCRLVARKAAAMFADKFHRSGNRSTAARGGSFSPHAVGELVRNLRAYP